jgi:nuclear migration protein JNM1
LDPHLPVLTTSVHLFHWRTFQLICPPHDQVSSPLLPTLGKLDHLLSLLTHPRHLDAISRRVKLLLVDLDRAAAAARSRTTTTQPERGSNVTLSQAEFTELQSLFSLLPRLDPLLPILPPLLARLRSLSGLHADASEVAEGLRRLQADDRRTGEEKVELERVVKGVQEGLGDAARGIERNWEGLETRMRGLEGRIQALHG